jgi:hypothetical protein
MAIQNFGICTPAPGVDVSLDYDDVSLAVLDVNYVNLSTRDARITLTVSGTPHDTILSANTQRTTKDISPLGIHMVPTTPPKGSPSIGLPTSVNVQCAWPA